MRRFSICAHSPPGVELFMHPLPLHPAPSHTSSMPKSAAMIVNHNRRIIFCSIERHSELIYVEMS